MRILLVLAFFVAFKSVSIFAGEQLDFYLADKKVGWEEYLAGNTLYLSGNITDAIKKWKEAAAKNNLHAATRLYHEDLQSGSKAFATFYEPLLKSKFAISNYLALRYGAMKNDEKLDALKKAVVDSMLELEGTDDWWALSIIGNYYSEKTTSKKECLLGVKFLLKAAEGGYSPAQDRIGSLYWEGNGFFNKDPNKAIKWLTKGAEAGDKFANLHLAQIYHKGSDNMPPDIPKSIPYYEEASKQGLTDAQLNLGLIYEEGQTVPKNTEKAHSHLSKLLESQDMEIYNFLGTRYFYSKEEWKDKKKGLLWYEKAAEIGTIVERYKYADLYYSDKDVQDYKKAFELFLELVPKPGVASHQFHILIYLKLGEIYFNGYGVKQDYIESKKYYDKVDQTSEALEAIISMYLNGFGVKQSDDMVLVYIDKLMAPTRPKGFEPGPYFYIKGNIYKKRGELAKSIENYRLAAICGDQPGMKALIELYAPIDDEKIGDIGDLHFALLKYEEAEKYYQKEESKNNLRNRYNNIRMHAIEKNKNYNLEKSIADMKKLAEENFADYTEKLDHVLIDRVIDQELISIPLKARCYYWLATQSKKINEDKEDKTEFIKECVSYFLLAEKSGCWFGGLNASIVLLRSDKPSDWAKAKEILDRLYAEKNPFAAIFLSGYYSTLKFGKTDFAKSETLIADAKAWDKQTLWNNISIDTLVTKGVAQLFRPEEKKKK